MIIAPGPVGVILLDHDVYYKSPDIVVVQITSAAVIAAGLIHQ